jgi:hypothetical protein
MNQLCIRHALEEKVREIGGHSDGGGFMTVPPFQMDFTFELDNKGYLVTLVNREALRKAHENPSNTHCGVDQST